MGQRPALSIANSNSHSPIHFSPMWNLPAFHLHKGNIVNRSIRIAIVIICILSSSYSNKLSAQGYPRLSSEQAASAHAMQASADRKSDEAFQKALHPFFSFSVIPGGWALLTDDVLLVPRLRDFVTVQPQPARCLRDRRKDSLCFVSIAVRTCRDEIIIIVPAPVLRWYEMVSAQAASSPSFIGGASVVTAVNALEAITEHYPVGCFA